jgi:hypothetical protein
MCDLTRAAAAPAAALPHWVQLYPAQPLLLRHCPGLAAWHVTPTAAWHAPDQHAPSSVANGQQSLLPPAAVEADAADGQLLATGPGPWSRAEGCVASPAAAGNMAVIKLPSACTAGWTAAARPASYRADPLWPLMVPERGCGGSSMRRCLVAACPGGDDTAADAAACLWRGAECQPCAGCARWRWCLGFSKGVGPCAVCHGLLVRTSLRCQAAWQEQPRCWLCTALMRKAAAGAWEPVGRATDSLASEVR